MTLKHQCILAAGIMFAASPAAADDACSARAITAQADVSVSDGSQFKVAAHYASPQHAAVTHIRDDGSSTIAVEGPFGWAQTEERAELGPDFYKLFALGHQYHALLLDFDAILPESDELKGARRAYPYGGVVEMLASENPARPAGMRFEFPDTPPIVAMFSDWRETAGATLPFRIEIDDGDERFDYRYTSVDIADRAPLWFADAVAAPAIDDVAVYRLHRRLLAAHCTGDAAIMAELAAPTVIIADRGERLEASRETIRAQFESVFEAIDYTVYSDLSPPIVEVAESGDLAWAAAHIALEATVRDTGAAIEDQWSWFMVARKIDGEWKYAGNSSSRRPSP